MLAEMFVVCGVFFKYVHWCEFHGFLIQTRVCVHKNTKFLSSLALLMLSNGKRWSMEQLKEKKNIFKKIFIIILMNLFVKTADQSDWVVSRSFLVFFNKKPFLMEMKLVFFCILFFALETWISFLSFFFSNVKSFHYIFCLFQPQWI